MPKSIKFFLGVVALTIIAIASVFYFTAGVVDVGDKFFMAVKAGDIDRAYTFLSEDFKANSGKNELQEYLSRSGFTNFKESSWTNRSISDLDGKSVGKYVFIQNQRDLNRFYRCGLNGRSKFFDAIYVRNFLYN